MGKHERAQKREAAAEMAAEDTRRVSVTADNLRVEREPEPAVRCVAIVRIVGAGYQHILADIPRDVLERYAYEVGQPDIAGIALGKAEEALEEYIAKGIVGR